MNLGAISKIVARTPESPVQALRQLPPNDVPKPFRHQRLLGMWYTNWAALLMIEAMNIKS
jgi:hypothetical protein